MFVQQIHKLVWHSRGSSNGGDDGGSGSGGDSQDKTRFTVRTHKHTQFLLANRLIQFLEAFHRDVARNETHHSHVPYFDTMFCFVFFLLLFHSARFHSATTLLANSCVLFSQKNNLYEIWKEDEKKHFLYGRTAQSNRGRRTRIMKEWTKCRREREKHWSRDSSDERKKNGCIHMKLCISQVINTNCNLLPIPRCIVNHWK